MHGRAFARQDQQAVRVVVTLDRDLHLSAGCRLAIGELLERQYTLTAAAGYVHEDVGTVDRDDFALESSRGRAGFLRRLPPLGRLGQQVLGAAAHDGFQLAGNLGIQVAQPGSAPQALLGVDFRRLGRHGLAPRRFLF